MFDTTVIRASALPERQTPALPVATALEPLLPGGLRRGITAGVTGSVSMLLALLGAASADGAWCALVGMPRISAEAVAEYGVALERFALVPKPGPDWTTVVGALLDALDVVAVRPPARPAPGDVRRLAARARSKQAVLIPYGAGQSWAGADVRLHATTGCWVGGFGWGYLPLAEERPGGATQPPEHIGRLKARQVEVRAEGRGAYARARHARLWLPAPGGGVATVITELASA